MKKRIWMLGLSVAVLALLLKTQTMAQETFHACSKKENGQLRIVSGPNQCLDSEFALLLNGTPGGPQRYNVNCNAGETVSEVLRTAPRTGPVTIAVQGICREAIYIDRDDLRIEGASSAAGFEAPTADSQVITLNGSRRIELFHLSFTAGREGITVSNSASFRAFNIAVSGASNNCMVVDASASGSLENSTIRNCKYGIGSNGAFKIINTTIEDIDVFGLYGEGFSLENGTVVQRCGHHGVLGSGSICNAIIQNNEGSGVWGSVDISCPGTIIRHNSEGGATAYGGQIDLRDGAQVIENNGGGVRGFYSGSVRIEGGVITNNTGDGLTLQYGASARIADGTIIKSNTGNGIYLGDTSVAAISNQGSGVLISNNGGYGITCLKNPSVAQIYIDDTSIVVGNTLGQIDCPQN